MKNSDYINIKYLNEKYCNKFYDGLGFEGNIYSNGRIYYFSFWDIMFKEKIGVYNEILNFETIEDIAECHIKTKCRLLI